MKRIILGCLGLVAFGCSGGGADYENTVPGEPQSPAKGYIVGADGELVLFGTQAGSKSSESGFPSGDSSCVGDAVSCEEACRCLGYGSSLCDDACHDYDDSGPPDRPSPDIPEPEPAPENPEPGPETGLTGCEEITDACLLCACQFPETAGTQCAAVCGL